MGIEDVVDAVARHALRVQLCHSVLKLPLGWPGHECGNVLGTPELP